MIAEPIPPTRRRWFQFRLRTLLVVMLVISLGLGWVMKERRRIAERRELFQRLTITSNPYRRVGNRATRFSLTSIDAADYEIRQQPAWNRLLFGDDSPSYAFSFSRDPLAPSFNDRGSFDVEYLTITEPNFSDAMLLHLACVKSLKTICLVDSDVTDSGIRRLQVELPECKISRRSDKALKRELKND